MGNNDVIKNFIEQVQWLHAPDYGDFKRKVGLYANRLAEALPPEAARQTAGLLNQLRADILFDASGDVECARTRAIELAKAMRDRIHTKL